MCVTILTLLDYLQNRRCVVAALRASGKPCRPCVPKCFSSCSGKSGEDAAVEDGCEATGCDTDFNSDREGASTPMKKKMSAAQPQIQKVVFKKQYV